MICKTVRIAILCASLACIVQETAQDLKPVQLPAPKTDGGMLLMTALKARTSSRDFSSAEISLPTISTMLWAACGINRPEDGKRTAPTARNNQEIDVYVATQFGLYLYDPVKNMLQPVVAGDIRAKTGKQGFVADAPINLIYVADYARMGNIPNDERKLYAAADAGFISQNVYLFCASEGLATVVRGWLDRNELARAMRLSDKQEIILAQTVGKPEK